MTVRRVGGVVAAGLVCVLVFRHLDLGALRAALAGASAWPLALALLVCAGPRTLARARRTLVLLRAAPVGRVAFRDLFPILLGGYAAGYLLSGPLEELFHGVALRKLGFRVRDLVSTTAVDKSLGILSVALVALPALPVHGATKLALAAAAVVVFELLGSAGRRLGSQVPRRARLEALACLMVSNLSSVAIVHLCLRGVGAPLPAGACLAIFAVASAAWAMPLTPGQIGVVEPVFVVAATRFGVAPGAALAASLFYRGVHVLPVAIGGLPVLGRVLLCARRPEA